MRQTLTRKTRRIGCRCRTMACRRRTNERFSSGLIRTERHISKGRTTSVPSMSGRRHWDTISPRLPSRTSVLKLGWQRLLSNVRQCDGGVSRCATIPGCYLLSISSLNRFALSWFRRRARMKRSWRGRNWRSGDRSRII